MRMVRGFNQLLKISCKWIEEKKCPPPVLFQTLADAAQ